MDPVTYADHIPPLHILFIYIGFVKFSPVLLSDKSGPAHPDVQMRRPGGHKWSITAVALLWSTETTSKLREVSLNIGADLGKALVENHLNDV